jgi:hypothetical protein
MRRVMPIVVAVLAASSAVAAGAGSLVGSAGARAQVGRSAMIVCPARATAPAIIPCCGPIVASPCCCCGAQPAPQIEPFCCPPTAMCARPLPSIASSPNPSTEGGAITISGVVSTTGATGVTLWQELPWQHSYRQLAQTSANAGSYSFSIAPGHATTNRLWYITSGGAKSAVDTQLVDAKVTAGDAVAGGRVAVSGGVTPSHVGGLVLIERQSGAQWSVVGRARIGRGSRYAAHIRITWSGGATLRVELPADRLNAESFSQTVSAG